MALGIQFIHFTEEYLTNFNVVVPNLLDREEYPMGYWLVFNIVAYFVFIIGGIVLFKKIKVMATTTHKTASLPIQSGRRLCNRY